MAPRCCSPRWTKSEEPVGGGTGTDTVSFVAHRYDVVTGTVTDAPIGVEILASSVGWAADSTRYLALLPGESGLNTVEPGALHGRLLQRDAVCLS